MNNNSQNSNSQFDTEVSFVSKVLLLCQVAKRKEAEIDYQIKSNYLSVSIGKVGVEGSIAFGVALDKLTEQKQQEIEKYLREYIKLLESENEN